KARVERPSSAAEVARVLAELARAPSMPPILAPVAEVVPPPRAVEDVATRPGAEPVLEGSLSPDLPRARSIIRSWAWTLATLAGAGGLAAIYAGGDKSERLDVKPPPARSSEVKPVSAVLVPAPAVAATASAAKRPIIKTVSSTPPGVEVFSGGRLRG